MDAFFASAAEYFQGSGSGFVSVFCTVWRYLAPVLAMLLLWRCARPLLKFGSRRRGHGSSCRTAISSR